MIARPGYKERGRAVAIALLLAVLPAGSGAPASDSGVGTTTVTGMMGAPAALPGAPVTGAALRPLYEGPTAIWPAPILPEGVALRELAPATLPDRPERDSFQGALRALGAELFEDPRLSPSGQISCESCHDRQLGWGDGLRRSVGNRRQEGRRNAQSLFSVNMRDAFFWDGRAASLQEQAVGPLTDPLEMANPDMPSLIRRLSEQPDLVARFRQVFGDGRITQGRLTDALASFQTYLDRPSDLDRFLRGDHDRLSDRQILGLHVFRTKAGCLTCHNGPYLTDGAYHSLGLTFLGRRTEDLGRYDVTGDPADLGAFRTPSLRHVSETAPYMHNGIFPTLANVLTIYEIAGGLQGPPDPDHRLYEHAEIARRGSPLLRRFELTEREAEALVAFLESL